MQALKRHYEKIVLGILLLAAFLLSFFLLNSLGKVREETQLAMAPVLATGEPVEQLTAADFDAQQLLGDPDVQWERAPADVRGNLVDPGQLMWCITEGCNHWLPYEAEICPYCGAEQKVTEGPEIPVGKDSDEDGITDLVENEYDFLDPDIPTDADQDEDGDWFTNLEEIKAGTDPADQASHPPLAEKLYFVGVTRERFGIVFSNVMREPDKPSEQWDIVLKVLEDGRWKSRFRKVGETIADYKVMDVQPQTKKVYDPSVGTEVTKDVSQVVLQHTESGEQVVLKRQTRSTTGIVIRLVLPVVTDGESRLRRYTARPNETFTLTDAVGQEETYKITAASPQSIRVRSVDKPESEPVVIERGAPERKTLTQGRFELSPGEPGLPEWTPGENMPPNAPR